MRKPHFYPKRARWYSRHLYPLQRWKSRLGLSQLPLGHLSRVQVILSVVIPGLAYCCLGRRLAGPALVAAYALGSMLFLSGIGTWLAVLVIGLLMALHALSLTELVKRQAVRLSPWMRVGVSLAATFSLAGFVYLPLQDRVERTYFLPLDIGGEIVVVQPCHSVRDVKAGDLIVCWLEGRVRGPMLGAGSYQLHTVEAVREHEIVVSPVREIDGLAEAKMEADAGEESDGSQAKAVSRSFPSPRDERVGSGPWRKETTKGGPPLPNPLLHRMEEREKSSILTQPYRQAEVHFNWFVLAKQSINWMDEPGEDASVIPISAVVGKPYKRWFWKRQVQS